MGILDWLFGQKPKTTSDSNVISDPDEIPDVLKQLSPILDEIGGEAIGGSPENWTNAVLTITCDGQRMDYSLKNRRNEPGTAVISPRLPQLAENMYTLMESAGDRWTKAEIQFNRVGDSWNVNLDFSYD